MLSRMPHCVCLAQRVVERLGAARERDVARVHVGRHHREQVLGADESLQHVDERLAGAARRRQTSCARCRGTPRTRGGAGRRPAGGHRRAHRIAPFLACRRRRQRHPFELRHLLRLAVLEHLEVVGREVGDRLALGVGGVDVHAHEVGFDAERRLPRRGRLRAVCRCGAGAGVVGARLAAAGIGRPCHRLRAHRHTRGREQHQGARPRVPSRVRERMGALYRQVDAECSRHRRMSRRRSRRSASANGRHAEPAACCCRVDSSSCACPGLSPRRLRSAAQDDPDGWKKPTAPMQDRRADPLRRHVRAGGVSDRDAGGAHPHRRWRASLRARHRPMRSRRRDSSRPTSRSCSPRRRTSITSARWRTCKQVTGGRVLVMKGDEGLLAFGRQDRLSVRAAGRVSTSRP